jgi:phage tail-like protein
VPAEFPKQTSVRFDRYKNFRFRVKWDRQYVAGFSKMSALDRAAPPISHREGGDPGGPRRMPGESEFAAITLERGVTHDVTFEQWCNKVWDYSGSTPGEAGSPNVTLADFRRDVVVELYDEGGQKVLAYDIFRCWVSEYQAMPELDANGTAVAIQKLVLQNEGWERDPSVEEPTEPGLTLPGV